jgi:BirA family biotin operon repressor/biotin-[acetyl-CoA-carboxylase] ligase
MFDLAALEAALGRHRLCGQAAFLPVTDSTNTDALGCRAQRRAARLGLLCRRAAGRPRPRRSRWHSAAGEGLYVSVLLRPPIPAVRLPLLAAGRGTRRRRGDSRRRRPRGRSALAQRSAHRPAQGRRHPGRGENRGGAAPLPWWASASTSTSAPFAPGLATPATSLDLEAGRAFRVRIYSSPC